MSGCVTVTGPPASSCLRKIGTTLPEEPRTLPKRTARKRVEELPVASCQLPAEEPCGAAAFDWQLTTGNWQPLLSDCTYNSATRFVAPITLVGFTALSVLTR